MADFYDPVQVDPEAFRNIYTMVPDFWERFDVSDLPVDITTWQCIKMLNDSCSDINAQITKIPTQCGGIYVYVIKPPVIPACGEYIMYVGKATKTQHQNLRARVRSYKAELGPDFKREKIHRLFAKWGKYVYVRYLPVDGTVDVIALLEDRLIAALTPPCNADIRIQNIKRAVNAF